MKTTLDWLMILLEVCLFVGLGLAYYYYQKRKIIRKSKEDLFYRVEELLKEVEHQLTQEQVLTLFENGQFTEIAKKIQSFGLGEQTKDLVKDLEEMNRYA